MDVSIIIVNYNSAALAADCVASVRARVRGASYEIIAVDNASRPEDLAALRSVGGVDILVENGANLGFGAANNRGVARSRGEFLFFLNPDCLLLNDAVSEFLAFFASPEGAEAGAAGCFLVDGKGAPNHYCGSFAGHAPRRFLANEARQSLKPLRRVFRPRGGRGTRAEAPRPTSAPTETRAVDWLNGAALFMPRRAFLEAGGFDERIFLFSEEVDLQRRLAALGYGRFAVAGPRVAHLHEKGRRMSAATRTHFYRGYLRYVAKHHVPLAFHATRLGLLAVFFFSALAHLFTREYRMVDDISLLSAVARFRGSTRHEPAPRRPS